jgi:hypothetical protein
MEKSQSLCCGGCLHFLCSNLAELFGEVGEVENTSKHGDKSTPKFTDLKTYQDGQQQFFQKKTAFCVFSRGEIKKRRGQGKKPGKHHDFGVWMRILYAQSMYKRLNFNPTFSTSPTSPNLADMSRRG